MASLTVWKFGTPFGADAALEKMKLLQEQQLIVVRDAAVVSWEEGKGKPKTRELRAVLGWRRRPSREVAAAAAAEVQASRNLVSRLTAQPSPRTAFTAGLVLFAPSITFLAAVQVIATASTRPLVTLIGLLIVIVVCLLLVWAPLLGYLAAPDATTGALRSSNGWLRAHGRELTVWALVIGGLALAVNGALGLAGVL
jgi:Sap, sulfolipid-1-addressing protein